MRPNRHVTGEHVFTDSLGEVMLRTLRLATYLERFPRAGSASGALALRTLLLTFASDSMRAGRRLDP